MGAYPGKLGGLAKVLSCQSQQVIKVLGQSERGHCKCEEIWVTQFPEQSSSRSCCWCALGSSHALGVPAARDVLSCVHPDGPRSCGPHTQWAKGLLLA